MVVTDYQAREVRKKGKNQKAGKKNLREKRHRDGRYKKGEKERKMSLCLWIWM